uniref:Phosphoribosylaminoimidazolesuccinocarboxamide synthase n=1 Tax=Steinernema glaseri TaxID=37863 RepID=A0A1I8A1R8_9BILA
MNVDNFLNAESRELRLVSRVSCRSSLSTRQRRFHLRAVTGLHATFTRSARAPFRSNTAFGRKSTTCEVAANQRAGARAYGRRFVSDEPVVGENDTFTLLQRGTVNHYLEHVYDRMSSLKGDSDFEQRDKP